MDAKKTNQIVPSFIRNNLTISQSLIKLSVPDILTYYKSFGVNCNNYIAGTRFDYLYAAFEKSLSLVRAKITDVYKFMQPGSITYFRITQWNKYDSLCKMN